jgi:hypothetical protein
LRLSLRVTATQHKEGTAARARSGADDPGGPARCAQWLVPPGCGSAQVSPFEREAVRGVHEAVEDGIVAIVGDFEQVVALLGSQRCEPDTG